MFITASKLYNYLQCSHRVWRDIYGPMDEKMEVNEFIKLLWEKGVLHEKEAIKNFGVFLDLSEGSYEERFAKTLDEMRKGANIIYQGVIQYENLLGIPDLLIKNDDRTYTPLDIKSGRGHESADEGRGDEEKLKKHYAVQLCLYLEILQKLGFSKNNTGIIYDIEKQRIVYELNQPIGKRNKKKYTEFYEEVKEEVWSLINNQKQNKPALNSKCKLCHWHDSCKKWVNENRDPSKIFYVGKSIRDTLNKDLGVERLEQILDLNIADLMQRKKLNKSFLFGIGEPTLLKIRRRAEIQHITKKPVIHRKFDFPKTSYELFFDVEDDPTQGFVYLHGVYELTKKGEKFIPFVAKSKSRNDERKAWQEFLVYLSKLPKDDFSLYYYSNHEKTIFKKLQEQYPDVITVEELDLLFSSKNTIDLYQDMILTGTDWPLSSYSLKDIATYLGFKWRDETPSGALSIKWYNEYLNTKDERHLIRILEYNEDDCKGTMVIKNFLEKNSYAQIVA